MAIARECLTVTRLTPEETTDELVDKLLTLYATVQEAVAGTDNDPLWVIGEHPRSEQLKAAAATGSLFVGRVGSELAGSLIVDNNPAPGYENVLWQIEAAPKDVAVMHLFAIHPGFRGQGLARPMVEAAMAAKKADGFTVLRLDTIIDNFGAQRTYEALGFTNLGPARLAYGPYAESPNPGFVLFEKAL